MSTYMGYAVWIPSVVFAIWGLVIAARVERVGGRMLTREQKSRQIVKMGILMALMLISGGLAVVFSSGMPLTFGNAIGVAIFCVIAPILVVLVIIVPARILLLGNQSVRSRKRVDSTKKV